MADLVFNVALGRIAEKIADGATLRLLLLRTAAADSVLRDLTNIAAVLASGGTAEANFTNYARQTLSGVQLTVDHANDILRATAMSVTFSSAGGAEDNSCVKAVVYEEVAGGDANCIPLVMLDVSFTTDGNDVTINFNANGFYTAANAA